MTKESALPPITDGNRHGGGEELFPAHEATRQMGNEDNSPMLTF